MAFHRATHHARSYPEQTDLESRLALVSPRGSIPGINNAIGSSGGRRRRPQSFRLSSILTWALLVLFILATFVRFHTHVRVLEEQQRGSAPIDVVGVSLKPSCVTRASVHALNAYLKPRVIHVVTTNAEKCRIFSSFASNVECHIQDELLNGLTVDAVGAYIEQHLGIDQHKHFKGRELSGWYMQQFLKLGSALALPQLSQHYVVWDLDMVLLRPVQLLFPPGPSDPAGSPTRALVNIGGSVSPGYMAAFRRLMRRPLEFAPDGTSFVTHWMALATMLKQADTGTEEDNVAALGRPFDQG
eukprot:XP_001701738.1 predicted protein [Chlamydomonas reinhardtii]